MRTNSRGSGRRLDANTSTHQAGGSPNRNRRGTLRSNSPLRRCLPCRVTGVIVLLERPFSPPLDQRKIQTQTDRPRVERPHGARVALHLLAVPCLLVVEKRIAPATLGV